MITEIAQIDVKPGSEKEFEAAIAKAEPIFRRCKGWKSFELHRGIEKPSRYRLHIKWETLENHTVDFRGSENFAEWRALVGPAFRFTAGGGAYRYGGELLGHALPVILRCAPPSARLEGWATSAGGYPSRRRASARLLRMTAELLICCRRPPAGN